MSRKLSKKNAHRTRLRRGKKRLPKLGKASFGVLATLVVVGSLSVALVFGLMRLSPYDSQTGSSFTCCDSGDGELCTPNTSVTLRVKINGQEVDYQLLKTGVKLSEGIGHLAPILPTSEYISGVTPGQYVYVSTISEDDSLQTKYVKEGGRCTPHGPRQDPMDTIFARSLISVNPWGCQAIPNDELVYLCTEGCEADPVNGTNGIFSVYFRTSDMPTPGIPEGIKNCDKPTEAQVTQGKQRIINLPSPSDHPNLQLETFYIEQDEIVADWVSPYCKPAIYLYPLEKTAVHVRVAPVGQMLMTIPTYPQGGWKVTAYPNGDIFYNDTRFDYLFYEASIPDESVTLPEEGYIVVYDSLATFIPDLVKKLGLNEKETNAFSEYWLHVLPKSAYYQIKIVTQEKLGKIAPMYIIPSPQTSIRVALHFTPMDKIIDLPEPEIVSPVREGFTVVEWGGIFKRDGKHDFSCFM